MFRKISTVTVVGVLGGCFFLPESYFPGPLKPINHMMNVASAGLKMGYIYKFSHEDIKTKNEKAS